MKKNLVVFSGAGISAESGLSTFRGFDGLWDNFDINDVATPEAWAKNPELVLDFYNMRREQALNAIPNFAHKTIAALEADFNVDVITQNIDDLHERSGSSKVLHLHGEVAKSRSTGTNKVFLHGNKPLNYGELCPDGFQLRPHIVWFGESVPNLEKAQNIIEKASAFIITGTSLNVYPAAGLIHFAPKNSIKYLVDPSDNIRIYDIKNLTVIKETSTLGIPKVAENLKKLFITKS